MIKKILILLAYLTLNLGAEGMACDRDDFPNKIKKFFGIKKNTQTYPLSDEQMDHIRQTIEDDKGSALPDGQMEDLKQFIKKHGFYEYGKYSITREGHIFKKRYNHEQQEKQGTKEVKCFSFEKIG